MDIMDKQGRGFTIVELLIVIVVIAILAAITVVAFNGAQQKALNSRTFAAINAYKKAIYRYSIDNNGSAPYGTRSNICLGSGYTSTVGAVSNVCATGALVGGQTIPDDDTTFTSNISKYLPSEPETGGQLVTNTAGDGQATGMFFWSSGRLLVYFLRGSGQTCSSGGTASNWNSSTTMCQETITLPN